MKKQFLIVFLITLFSLFIFQAGVLAEDNLREKVETAIANYYFEDISVSIEEEGKVDLEGNVPTLYDKYRIFEIVSKVNGVRAISNQISIATDLTPDKIIKDNIIEEMHLVSAIKEPDSIQIEVKDGVVFLDGRVSYYREKIMMRTIASWQEGVRSVVNNLEVLPFRKVVKDENMKEILSQILKHEYPLEENVRFTVDDGEVTLNGTVRTLWAKRNIEESFSDVLGIKNVVNYLDVEPVG